MNNESDLEFEEEEIYLIIEDYLEKNIKKCSSPEFYEKMGDEIIDFFLQNYYLPDVDGSDDSKEKEEITEIIWDSIDEILLFYNIPKRQNVNDDDFFFVGEKEKQKNMIILRELDKINNLQPKQRTSEWYQYRYNRFSASSIWKLLSTPSQYNSMILEKCKPYIANANDGLLTNYNNPRNWGIKYERVSMMIYEDKHPTTKVKTDYGCIPHPLYSFIGASPDGINISPECPEKYGRMVEVKNIYNRDITGIPLEEYWIQMQIQMETCGLNTCDFLETRFKEYLGEKEFYEDSTQEYKGVILFFLAKNSGSEHFFEYMPLYVNLEKRHINKWICEIQEKNLETHILYEKIYWYLDEYSCVIVERNIPWFESVLPIIEEAWNIVISERKMGYKHREPVSRNSKDKGHSIIITKKMDKFCVVKIDSNIIKPVSIEDVPIV